MAAVRRPGRLTDAVKATLETFADLSRGDRVTTIRDAAGNPFTRQLGVGEPHMMNDYP